MLTIDCTITPGNERETVLAIDDLLRQMDRAQVDRAVIQPQDRCLAVANAEGNRRMLEMARAHPDRLVPACSVNPWYGRAAAEELLRAVADGARMLVLAPALQGYILGDELLNPVLDALGGRPMPVYVHTGPHLQSAPWQLALLAERYPHLPFIMGHSGATDFWTDVVPAARAAPNIYLESSFARPFTFARHLQALGAERGIMGSAAPRNDLKFEWEQMRAVLKPDAYSGFYGATLAGLLERGAL